MVKGLTEHQARINRLFNEGYTDGYRMRESRTGMPEPYYTGYDAGKSDRDEDNAAVASGDFDLLNEEERKEVYGDESDRI
jgi:hypothetical protein